MKELPSLPPVSKHAKCRSSALKLSLEATLPVQLETGNPSEDATAKDRPTVAVARFKSPFTLCDNSFANVDPLPASKTNG
jgi:hypothetical protein